jgi:hypothetical protein
MPLLAIALAASLFSQQEIPPGVRYKKAPDAVNALAQAKLEKFFASDPKTVDMSKLGAEAVVVGPGMWSYIKNGAPPDLVGATKAQFHIPNANGVQVLEGRVLKTEDQQSWIWLALLVGAHKAKPTIRKANAEEIQYYWAIIPYDIEEPLYVADFGKNKFLIDFDDNAKDPKIFDVDRVLPMSKPN